MRTIPSSSGVDSTNSSRLNAIDFDPRVKHVRPFNALVSMVSSHFFFFFFLRYGKSRLYSHLAYPLRYAYTDSGNDDGL